MAVQGQMKELELFSLSLSCLAFICCGYLNKFAIKRTEFCLLTQNKGSVSLFYFFCLLQKKEHINRFEG